MNLYMFRTVTLSIIRSLFIVHSTTVYVIQVCRQLSSRIRMELQSSLLAATASGSRIKLDIYQMVCVQF
jgi:hypothetical protein